MDSFDKMYQKEVRRFRSFNDSVRMAFEFLKHYEYYSDSTYSIEQVFNEVLNTNITYNKKEQQELLDNTIKLLRMQYNIVVVSTSPLIMEKMN